MKPESISAIMVKLEVADQQSLFIVLADDGLVNRSGTGSINNNENDLFIGKTKDSLFAQLKAQVRPEWMERLGSYDLPAKTGKICELSVLFQSTTGEDGGITFTYGADSQGPPQDIRHFVMEAIRLTDPWYQEQKKIVANSKKSK